MAILVAGCGSPDGSTWLLKTSAEEVAVIEAGSIWNGLDHNTRERFLSGDNPVGDFIAALGRETMINEEIENDTYLHSSAIQNMKECWLISSVFIAYKDSLSVSFEQEVTEYDLANYRELLDCIVWFSLDTGRSQGPERLGDLEWNLAFAFDSMSAGSSIEIDGILYTLDSVVTSSQEMLDQTLSDFGQINTFALTSLIEARVGRVLTSLKEEVRSTLTIDSAAVSAYCTQRESVEESTELASWSEGSISAKEFDGIAAFFSLGQTGKTQSPEWVFHNLENHAILSYIASLYASEFPEDYSSIQAGARAFAVDQASELLFKANVTDVVEMSDSMVIEAFSQMVSIPLLPETRVFESVMVSGGVLDDVITLLDCDNDLLELGYPGYTEFLTQGSVFLSRPVRRAELPREMDLTLFLLEESDTLWQRPVEISENLFVFYRLAAIIPPHAASFEQMETSIRRNLLIHLEEQRTMEWMCELEAAHQLRINLDILSDLPLDPSVWSEL